MADRRTDADYAATTTLHHEFAATTASLGDARDAVANWLRSLGGTDDDIDRATLLASELASNAIQASPDTTATLRAAALPGHRIALSVTNYESHSDVPPREHWGPDDVLSVQGRGLTIVTAISDTVDVQVAEPNGVTITATVALDPGNRDGGSVRDGN